jgi:3-oxoacyl-[acyl-carrier protein] reductase
MKILITGGASGLGAAITRRLSKEAGNTVYFTYANSETKALQLQQEFKNTVAIKCDFKNPTELEALKNKLESLEIDVLVNNAYHGDAIKSYFHKIPEADFATEFIENVLPIIGITQVALNGFRKRKQGKIITILTSFLVNTPPIGASSYVACKAYLGALVKSWASENAKFNVTSNAVSPSFMQTGLTADVDERIIEQMNAGHPLKKLLTPEEVAETVLFLTTASLHLNGVDLLINAATDIK